MWRDFGMARDADIKDLTDEGEKKNSLVKWMIITVSAITIIVASVFGTLMFVKVGDQEDGML